MRFFDLAASTHDQEVFSFYPDETFCNGFEEVLTRYRELVPNLKLAGYNSSLLPFIHSVVSPVLILFSGYFPSSLHLPAFILFDRANVIRSYN